VLAYVAGVSATFTVLGSTYVVLGGLGTGTGSGVSADGSATTPSPVAPALPDAAGERAATVPAGAAETCRPAIAAGERAVTAARLGVEHWDAHVRARTDGLAGRISAEQMRAIWKRTRLAGPADVAQFNAAEKRYASLAAACASAIESSGSATEATRVCRGRATAAADAVDAARRATGDWAAHQANMREFADGAMRAEHAQHEWERAWRTAPANITGYRDAVDALQRVPACPR
jgi:hypothetical protein